MRAAADLRRPARARPPRRTGAERVHFLDLLHLRRERSNRYNLARLRDLAEWLGKIDRQHRRRTFSARSSATQASLLAQARRDFDGPADSRAADAGAADRRCGDKPAARASISAEHAGAAGRCARASGARRQAHLRHAAARTKMPAVYEQIESSRRVIVGEDHDWGEAFHSRPADMLARVSPTRPSDACARAVVPFERAAEDRRERRCDAVQRWSCTSSSAATRPRPGTSRPSRRHFSRPSPSPRSAPASMATSDLRRAGSSRLPRPPPKRQASAAPPVKAKPTAGAAQPQVAGVGGELRHLPARMVRRSPRRKSPTARRSRWSMPMRRRKSCARWTCPSSSTSGGHRSSPPSSSRAAISTCCRARLSDRRRGLQLAGPRRGLRRRMPSWRPGAACRGPISSTPLRPASPTAQDLRAVGGAKPAPTASSTSGRSIRAGGSPPAGGRICRSDWDEVLEPERIDLMVAELAGRRSPGSRRRPAAASRPSASPR